MNAAGKAAWTAELKAILDTTPAQFVGAAKVLKKDDWKAKVRLFFAADTAVHVAAGYAGAIADIAAQSANRRALWMAEVYRVVGVTKPPATPTKAALWQFFGYNIGHAGDWTLVALGDSGLGHRLHLTVSADSIISPVTLGAAALNQAPEAIWAAMFMAVAIDKRVHVTRESDGRHYYLGGVNGAGAAIADGAWGGNDAGEARVHLANFKAQILTKMLEAKALGWNV